MGWRGGAHNQPSKPANIGDGVFDLGGRGRGGSGRLICVQFFLFVNLWQFFFCLLIHFLYKFWACKLFVSPCLIVQIFVYILFYLLGLRVLRGVGMEGGGGCLYK